MIKRNKILIFGVITVVLILGVFPYDTDDSYDPVLRKYGYDIGERTLTPSCETDGVGLRHVPFGVITTHCETSWFVFFNMFPFQVTGVFINTDQNSTNVFLADISSLKDWYAHRISDNSILLTKQETLPDIGATEGYAYGEQISINLMELETYPEEWVAQHIYLDDVLVSKSEWGAYRGQKLLTVESEAGGASGKQYTQYIFTDELIFVVSLYPFEIYDDASEKYVRNTEAVYDARRVLYRLLPQILTQESVQRQLEENCARDIPREKIDDSSFDPENKIVQTYWWDNEINDNVQLIIPYEPETDFAGCSESVKELLRHIQGISGEDKTEQMDMDTINATIAGDYSAMISDVSGLGPAMVTVELSPMSPLAGPGARASLTIDYVDIGISSVWKIGGWNISKDNVVVTLSGTTEQEFNKPEIIEFIFQKDTLVAVNYDESIYGEKGLQLQRPVVIELQGTTTGEIGRRPI